MNIQELWKEAEANPGKKVDLGRTVVCDICDKDWTDKTKSGGFIFGSKAYCPECALRSLKSIMAYGEGKYIKAHCPSGVSFADFVRGWRGDKNYIKIDEVAF